jgi:hypothetical protein
VAARNTGKLLPGVKLGAQNNAASLTKLKMPSNYETEYSVERDSKMKRKRKCAKINKNRPLFILFITYFIAFIIIL